MLYKLAWRHYKSMEKAAKKGCRANSLQGIHGVHAAIEVTVEIFEVKANLQIPTFSEIPALEQKILGSILSLQYED